MRARVVGGIVALCLAGTTLAACGDDGTDADDPTTTTSTTAAGGEGFTSTTGGASTTAASAPDALFLPVEHDADAGTDGDVLLDGRHFGYLTELTADADGIHGRFDLAEYYSGAEAEEASIADGHGPIDGGSQIYIRNANPLLRPIVVDGDAEVYDLNDGTGGVQNVPKSAADYAATRSRTPDGRTAVNLTIDGGRVTQIQTTYFE